MKKPLLLFFAISATVLLIFCGCGKKNKSNTTLSGDDSIAIGIEMGQTLIQEGDLFNGIKTLEELNQHYPNQTEILEALAFAHINQNNHLEAAFYFESIAKLDSAQANLFLQAAQSYEEGKEYYHALRCYKCYLEIHPADGKAWKSYAKALIKGQQFDQALQAYIQALSTENGKPTPLEVLSIGKLFFKQGDFSQANDWYELGKATAESRPYALLGQAEIHLKQSDLTNSERMLDTLIEEYPTFKNRAPYIDLRKKLQETKIRLHPPAAPKANQT